jgi:hypothetical protein
MYKKIFAIIFAFSVISVILLTILYVYRKEKYDGTSVNPLQLPSNININKIDLTPETGVQLIDALKMPVKSRYNVPLFQATNTSNPVDLPSTLIMNDNTYFIDEDSFSKSIIFSTFYSLVSAWVNCDMSSCQQMLYAPVLQQYLVLENGQPFSLSSLEGTRVSIVSTNVSYNTYKAVKTIDGNYFITLTPTGTTTMVNYTSEFVDGSIFFGQNNNSLYFNMGNLITSLQGSSFGIQPYTYNTDVFVISPNTQFLSQLIYSTCIPSTCRTDDPATVMVPYKINRIVVRGTTNNSSFTSVSPYVFSIDAQNGLQATYIKRILLEIGAVPYSLYGQTDIQNQLYQEKIRMKDEQDQFTDAYKKGYQKGSTERCKGVPSTSDSIFADICNVVSVGSILLA